MFERLLEIREDKELTQNDMSKIIGVERSVISKWENNKELIPLKHLNDYANYFNVSFDYLAGLSNEKNNYKVKSSDLNLEIIGNRIKEIRKNNKLTLRDLASVLNTSSSTISAYETGKVLISTNFAYIIAFKYKVSLDWLCGRIKEKI